MTQKKPLWYKHLVSSIQAELQQIMQSSRLNLFFGESSSTLLLIRHPNEFGTDSEQSSVTDIIFLAVKFLYIVE